MDQENLWGELPQVEKIETPRSILQAQARTLEALSQGRLTGQIVVTKSVNNAVVNAFRIVVPALDNYSVTILSVDHPAELYPARVYETTEDGWKAGIVVNDATELRERLRIVLQSPHTRTVVTALLAQIKDVEDVAQGN